MTWLTAMEYLCHKWAWICSTCRKHFPVLSLFMTYHRVCRWVQLVEEVLLTLPEHLRSPLVLSGVRVTRSLVLYVCFGDHCLSFCTFSFGQCVVCSATYGVWLPIWYLQTLLILVIRLFTLIYLRFQAPQTSWSASCTLTSQVKYIITAMMVYSLSCKINPYLLWPYR